MSETRPVRTISRAVVIGSGTMGGGIAAHFANAGIPVYLLDIIEPPLDRIRKHKPPAFFTPETAELVTAGKLDEHEAWIAEGDWIVEAIVENMDAKRDLIARIDRLRKPHSIVSSNTSGLPIAQIAANASAGFKKHFIGTHFFNPPRYMKLLEVIPTPDTAPEITQFVRDFAEQRLGKGVVLCKDTPNFIANRLASMGGVSLSDFALANDYTVEETDAIAGPLIGRPKTAAFRLQDLVGLDVASAVASNLYDLIEGDESREVLRSPRFKALLDAQMGKGRLGDKSGQGFYKKDGKTILSLDFKTGEYRERLEPQIASLAEASKIRSLPERVRFVLQQDDKAGALARHVIYNSLGYASRRVPEISDDLVSIDRATRWGFSHDLGPFELWDAIGVRATADAMEKHGVAVAPWVREMLAAGNESFYRDGAVYDPASRSYVAIPSDPRAISLRDCRVVKENKGASLRDLGDGVLCLEFHTKLNTLDGDIRAMLVESVEELERGEWVGLVIGNEGGDFCAGANLAGGLAGDPSAAVKGMQDALMRVRFSTRPVVAAPFARTLGGGVEVCMAAARVVAYSETYMGLVEVGVGLIPGAGGCKEMVRRIVSPAMKRTPNADPLPLVQNILQTVGAAKVSSSAEEARSFGFLSDADRIVMNRDHLLYEAKQEVLALAVEDRQSCLSDRRDRLSPTCFASGRDVRAGLKAAIYVLQQGGYMTEYDAFLSGKLAHILCGGDLTRAQWVSEQTLLDLEREVFIELLGQQKTIDRIQHMLQTGKPLRN
ncbi:MAG TPA: 3-hydroxyacyl-CoA dehydrogenase/enoyl-CoA hydratase family protein [Thermoanaerobaculia bacterium]|nr:3-hydroxyacyl-CoA dehydrogenase/enoyl-CoA hydratase family protein [Thermoanaerobaculia bacterium]